jgi:hypothetical protein
MKRCFWLVRNIDLNLVVHEATNPMHSDKASLVHEATNPIHSDKASFPYFESQFVIDGDATTSHDSTLTFIAIVFFLLETI